MPPWLVPIRCSIRWRISAAALLVKVTAIIEYGEQFSTDSSQAMRCTSTGLAAARPGQNQQVAARRRHGFTLFFIQAVEQIGDVHRHH